MNNRILIIAAHPDDDILGCGGMSSKYKSVDIDIRVIFIVEGTSCRFNESDLNSAIVQEEIYQRNSYGIKALNYLGVNNYKFYNLPCGRLDTVPIININKIMENEIREFKPTIIFTHSENDTNNDHRIIFRSTLMATRPVLTNKIRQLISFEILSSSEWNFGSEFFKPNFFIELSEQNVQDKINALNFYESETKPYPFPRSTEGIKINCQYRGMQIGVKYAEAYKLLRSLEL